MAGFFDFLNNVPQSQNNQSNQPSPVPWNTRTPMPTSSPSPSDGSSWNTRIPFTPPQDNTQPNTSLKGFFSSPDISSPFSSAQNWQQNIQNLPQSQPQQSDPSAAPSSGGFFSNLWGGIGHAAGAASNFVGQKFDQFEKATGLNHIAGAMKGISNPNHFDTNVAPSDGSYLGNLKNWGDNAVAAVKNLGQSAAEGFTHPDETTQSFNDKTNQMTQNADPVSSIMAHFLANAGTDPMSFFPMGAAGKALGTGIKTVSDATKLTPIVNAASSALRNAPVIKPAMNNVKDILGKMFTPNYGASPDLVSALKESAGNHAGNQSSIINALHELAGNSKGIPELDQTGHMIEKTFSGPMTPEQHSFLSQFENLRDNGPAQAARPIGTDALANTASAVTGEPLLNNVRDNYFTHMYRNMPDELKGVFPKQQEAVPGLSSNGSFNKPRTFGTLLDAQNAGLKPEMNPFQVLGEHLNNTSKALTNNDLIGKIKSTPGILFDKDPIDEVAKLVKTGRMTADQAAAHLGMSLDDLKKGFVQSKVPQLSGAYIRPADEAALTEHLNPSKASGILGFTDKINNLYNKGFLLNPLPHLHNVTTNGLYLGEANPHFAEEAFNNLKNGVADPHYTRALQSGAISNPVGGKFSDAIDKATNGTKNPFMMAKNASHDLLWNTDASIRTALHREAIQNGMTDAQAAAHTNKFMVDYQNLTPFEKKYIKPIINFYAWKKGNIPLQASQMIAQTPKYAIPDHLKNAISQELGGNGTDDKGRIDPNQQLPDGSHTMIDPYLPIDEVGKIANKGVLSWLYNSMNPGIKEGIDQGTSLAQALGLPIQNKFPIYNPSAPSGDNIAKGAAHATNALNPLNSSAVLGGAGVNQSNLINSLFGQKTKDNPGLTPTEMITKLLGGFTGRVNPAKDAKNAAYAQRDSVLNHIKYEKSAGIPVSKAEKKAAYRKIK